MICEDFINRKTTPRVSIIMAVYNGERHLLDTILSILEQTFRDFEYIIVNDGSTDNTQSILERVADSRVIMMSHEHNNGLAYSLNRGLEIAQGKYIARIDAGDIAVPERLEKQVTFLEQHPEIGIVGTCCILIDDLGKKIGEKRFPLNDLEIRWVSVLTNPFLHPSVMIRREILCQHNLTYDVSFQASQDYELWTRLLKYTHGANLAEPLTVYRLSKKSITTTMRSVQFNNQDTVILRTVHENFPNLLFSRQQATQLRETFIGSLNPENITKKQQSQFADLYLELLTAFVIRYSKKTGIESLKRRETRRIALLALQSPYVPSWTTVVTRAIRLYPGVLWPLMQYIGKKYILKRGRHFMYVISRNLVKLRNHLYGRWN